MIRSLDFRYAVIRNGAELCEIYPFEGSEPTIRMDSSAEIKMSMSATFLPDSRVDWLTDKIRVQMIVDGAAVPLGLFLVATVRNSETEQAKFVTIEAYDQCWRVRDYCIGTSVVIASGTEYILAVQQLLTAAGIGVAIVTPNSAAVTEARVWDIGTPFLTIVNELLAEINYKPLWFNAEGYPVLEPKSVPAVENIQHTLDENDIKSLLLPQIVRETDIYSAPNVFIVCVDNPDKSSTLTATAVNDQVNSPLCVQRRGRQIVKFVHLDNIASQQELQKYADQLVRESMYIGETVEIVTGILPGFGVNDIVALNMSDVFSICLERSWEMNLKVGGEMRHTLERVIYEYGQ